MIAPRERLTRLLLPYDPAFVPRGDEEVRTIWARTENETRDPQFVADLKRVTVRWQAIPQSPH